MNKREAEPVDITLCDLGASLDGKDRPHVHRLVLVPDCLRVAYAAGKGSISENILFRSIPSWTLFFSPVGHDGSGDINTVPVAVDTD